MSVVRALAGSAALLLAAPLASCGGGDGSDDTGVEDFCAAYFGLFSGGMDAVDPLASGPEQGAAMAEALRTWAAELDRVGAPAAMPERARAGLELIVRAAAELEPGDGEHLAALADDFSEDEMAATEAFQRYATQSCESPFDDPLTG